MTPSKTGYTFTPTSQPVTLSGSPGTADFTWIVTPATIFGYVREQGTNNPVSGVTMTLSGSGGPIGTTPTNASGYYSFASIGAGTYTVAPSKAGCTFTPTSRSVTMSGSDQQADFTCAILPPTDLTISGYVRTGGVGLSGVTMTLSGTASQTATTGASGYYAFMNLGNGSYTVTPSKTGYTFTPTSQPVTLSGASATANFTGY